MKPPKPVLKVFGGIVAPVRWLGRGLKHRINPGAESPAVVAPVRWLGRGLKPALFVGHWLAMIVSPRSGGWGAD